MVYPISNDYHSGGLEMLFNSKKQQTISLPTRTSAGAPTTVADLINHLTVDLTQRHQKKELFVLDGSVCV